MDHFIVEYLVAWPLNESVDLVLMENSLPFLCEFQLIGM